MFDAIDPMWFFSACVFGLALMLFDAVHSLYFGASARTQVNRRLQAQEGEESRVQTIVDLRRVRGLGENADWRLSMIWLNRLIVQSGINMGIAKLAILPAAGAAGGGALGFLTGGLTGSVIGAAVMAALFPLALLLYLRKRRMQKFTEQFAEAIDIIVRSLRAGHPVPSAIRLAAREMPDPIGSEFGMVEDEITFGLDLESAMRNLAERVGQQDLPLFVASVAIQASSGGNLTEILSNLSDVIRMRVKMRRKINAVSAEGKISAIILSVTPFALFGIINLMSPGFYGAHWQHPWMLYGLGGAFCWMAFGNLVMRKMINFKF